MTRIQKLRARAAVCASLCEGSRCGSRSEREAHYAPHYALRAALRAAVRAESCVCVRAREVELGGAERGRDGDMEIWKGRREGMGREEEKREIT